MESYKWQLDTAERLSSIERSIKYIESNLSNLPQSPACVHEFKDVHRRIEELEVFKTEMVKRIAWVSGAFAVLTATALQFLDVIKSFFKAH